MKWGALTANLQPSFFCRGNREKKPGTFSSLTANLPQSTNRIFCNLSTNGTLITIGVSQSGQIAICSWPNVQINGKAITWCEPIWSHSYLWLANCAKCTTTGCLLPKFCFLTNQQKHHKLTFSYLTWQRIVPGPLFLVRPPLEPSQNDIWVTSTEIPNWWCELPRSW